MTGSFPYIYKDLEEVCSEERCEELPPHQATNCTIELISGAKLPKPRIYSMTPRELSEIRDYIDKNLARGFIQPSRSRLTTMVLFWEKKDGGLCLCVDFHGLNVVCVEHLYPLPLLKDELAISETGFKESGGRVQVPGRQGKGRL